MKVEQWHGEKKLGELSTHMIWLICRITCFSPICDTPLGTFKTLYGLKTETKKLRIEDENSLETCLVLKLYKNPFSFQQHMFPLPKHVDIAAYGGNEENSAFEAVTV